MAYVRARCRSLWALDYSVSITGTPQRGAFWLARNREVDTLIYTCNRERSSECTPDHATVGALAQVRVDFRIARNWEWHCSPDALV
jgi:hypothetical protein